VRLPPYVKYNNNNGIIYLHLYDDDDNLRESIAARTNRRVRIYIFNIIILYTRASSFFLWFQFFFFFIEFFTRATSLRVALRVYNVVYYDIINGSSLFVFFYFI